MFQLIKMHVTITFGPEHTFCTDFSGELSVLNQINNVCMLHRFSFVLNRPYLEASMPLCMIKSCKGFNDLCTPAGQVTI